MGGTVAMVAMVDTEGGVAMAILTPSRPAKTARNAVPNPRRNTATEAPDTDLKRANEMLNMKVVTWSLATWATFTFVFCVVYGMLTPASMHMETFLRQVLPGFESNSWRGFLIGLIQSFLYGAFAGLVYVPIYNFFHLKWVRQ